MAGSPQSAVAIAAKLGRPPPLFRSFARGSKFASCRQTENGIPSTAQSGKSATGVGENHDGKMSSLRRPAGGRGRGVLRRLPSVTGFARNHRIGRTDSGAAVVGVAARGAIRGISILRLVSGRDVLSL